MRNGLSEWCAAHRDARSHLHSGVERGKKPFKVKHTHTLDVVDEAAIYDIPLLDDVRVEQFL